MWACGLLAVLSKQPHADCRPGGGARHPRWPEALGGGHQLPGFGVYALAFGREGKTAATTAAQGQAQAGFRSLTWRLMVEVLMLSSSSAAVMPPQSTTA